MVTTYLIVFYAATLFTLTIINKNSAKMARAIGFFKTMWLVFISYNICCSCIHCLKKKYVKSDVSSFTINIGSFTFA